MKAIDCMGFAGGFSLGVVQAGFKLVGKKEKSGAYGAGAMEGNRHLLGDYWVTEACDPAGWTPTNVDLVFGNPPCSGFSVLTPTIMRGLVGNPINDCMDDLVQFGLRCTARTIIFESVQDAYKKGADKMRGLLATANAFADRNSMGRYTLTHVLHNCLSCGGVMDRKRYFFVLSMFPFAVERRGPQAHTTLRDAIGDIEKIGLPYEGHYCLDGRFNREVAEIAAHVEWKEGEFSGTALERYEAAGIVWPLDKPPSMNIQKTHMFSPKRWRYDSHAFVVVGDTLTKAVHPRQPRTLTQREVARIMGFPDDWWCAPYAGGHHYEWWGKGISVQTGQWIGEAARVCLEYANGEPWPDVPEGTWTAGVQIGENERLIDVTDDWRAKVKV